MPAVRVVVEVTVLEFGVVVGSSSSCVRRMLFAVYQTSLHFGNQAAMAGGNRPKALWLCVIDFRRLCLFEKRLGGSREHQRTGSGGPDQGSHDRQVSLRN